MTQHFLHVTDRSTLGPWGLVEQLKQLRWVRRLVMGVGDGRLEGWRHLVLEYPPELTGVYEETDVNASPDLPKVLSTHVAESG
jgi:hypothetical protein